MTTSQIQTLTEEQTVAVKRLASARNYQYEANMGDYSQGSIDRAARGRAEAVAACVRLGIENPESRVEWHEGSFRAI